MRFLIDNALSPEVAEHVRAAGHEAIHVHDRGLAEAEDEVVLDLAAAEGRVIITADTDFGGLLVLRQLRVPSVIQFRHGAPRRPAQQAALLLANLPAITDDLTHGAIVTIRRDRLRVRRLS